MRHKVGNPGLVNLCLWARQVTAMQKNFSPESTSLRLALQSGREGNRKQLMLQIATVKMDSEIKREFEDKSARKHAKLS